MPVNRDMTTGQVAALLCVSSGTVVRWCDRGLLPHYRVPGSTQRRVRRADLENFCQRHRVPLATIERDRQLVEEDTHA